MILGPFTLNVIAPATSVGLTLGPFTLNVIAPILTHPYAVSTLWAGGKTPALVIGDTFRNEITLNSDGMPFDLSSASGIEFCIVSHDHATQFTDVVSIARTDDWASGEIMLYMPGLNTADIAEHISAESFAWAEIQATLGDDKYTWFGAVRVVPGHIN